MTKIIPIVVISLLLALTGCNEEIQLSEITTVAPFIISDAPSLIVTSDEEDITIPISFFMSDDQIITTTISVSVDANSTATEGEDFTISTDQIEIEGFQNRGNFDITILGDIIPEGTESIFIRLAGEIVNGQPWAAANEAVIEAQIVNFEDLSNVFILCDWDGSGTVPSLGATFPLCGNVDLDPIYFKDAGATFGDYSDNPSACPETFSDILSWDDDYYVFEAENYENAFGTFPNALGDLCMRSFGIQVGVEIIDLPQRTDDCFLITELGYNDVGGGYRRTSLFNMQKTGNTLQFFDPVDNSVYGTLNRSYISPEHQAAMDYKKSIAPQQTSVELVTE